MMYFILAIYLLGAVNVFITEMKIENTWLWSLFLAISYPLWEAIGGILWILVLLEKLVHRTVSRVKP